MKTCPPERGFILDENENFQNALLFFKLDTTFCYSFFKIFAIIKNILNILGYEGDASIECTPVKTCPPGRGFILDENENCVCPPGWAFDENGNCVPCPSELGFIVDAQGRCVCDSSRGLILDPVAGRCICPPGYELNENGICVESKYCLQ